MALFPRVLLACALAFAAGCSSNPKADDPTKSEGGSGQTDVADQPDANPSTSGEPAGSTSTAMPTGVKIDGVDRANDNSVPDDYSLVERDCVDLGKKLGDLWRADLRKSLSPKLTDKQREKAEASIQDAATKKEDDWAAGCIKSLVGKSVDPKSLKCAFDSKDLKAFEACLN